MTWFKVDDSLHSHPKAMAASLAALGLWAVAGSWSSDHLTDGFVPDHMIPSLSRGSDKLVEDLVAAGLWKRVRGGYQFHQWNEDGDGTKRNPSKKEVVDNRSKRAEAGRKGGLASGKSRSKRRSKDEANASTSVREPLNPRPVPSRPEGTRTDTGSQSSSRRNAPAWAEDDDSIDLGIVELLAELTGQQISAIDATAIRQRILGSRVIRTSRAAYVETAIVNDPGKFLPVTDDNPGHETGTPRLRSVSEWCGHCDSDDYRWLQLPDGRWDKCPACNPDAEDPFGSKEVS
ncbi:hypothetical protein [Nonomuraea typhae]|uniref:hypothetical protein n=1 Tax=Nonomuraea typhae TaxID=2603600 RepID=UPI0012F9D4FA|nr:hypothetical protein [Nonomuraea typhae]